VSSTFFGKGAAMTDMAGTSAIDTGSGFRIGDVLERTFSILGRNFLPFILLSGIATLPYLAFYWNQSGAPFAPMAPSKIGSALFLPLLLGAVLKILTQAVIVYGAFQDMRRQSVRIGESLRVGLARILPIMGLLICYSLGVSLGMILLLVPGLIFLTMWYVAIPVCVVERLGPLKSLGRSRALTKGHRWKLFGLLVLLGIAGGILGAAVPYLARMAAGRVAFVIVQYLVQAVVGAFSAILVVVVYRDLRVAKDGIDTDRIAAVFD
jgi:hypothetical protein